MATFNTINLEEYTEQELKEFRYFYLMDYVTEDVGKHHADQTTGPINSTIYELDVIEVHYDKNQNVWQTYEISCVYDEYCDVSEYSRNFAYGTLDNLRPANYLKLYLTKETGLFLPVWDFIKDIEALEDEDE